MAVGEIVQDRVGQTEVRNPVAHDAADLAPAVEDSHVITVASQDHGDGQA